MTKAGELLLRVQEGWDDKKYMKCQGGQEHSNSSNRLTPGKQEPSQVPPVQAEQDATCVTGGDDAARAPRAGLKPTVYLNRDEILFTLLKI